MRVIIKKQTKSHCFTNLDQHSFVSALINSHIRVTLKLLPRTCQKQIISSIRAKPRKCKLCSFSLLDFLLPSPDTLLWIQLICQGGLWIWSPITSHHHQQWMHAELSHIQFTTFAPFIARFSLLRLLCTKIAAPTSLQLLWIPAQQLGFCLCYWSWCRQPLKLCMGHHKKMATEI